MVFSSLFFVFFFLALNLIAYHFADGIKRKNMVLLGFSLVFYSWGGPKYLLLLLSMVFASWLFALLIDQYREEGLSKIFLICDCVFMLGLLCIFKYLTFFSSITNTIFHFPKEIPQIALPIGISFYTFQLLSYVIDVYREEVAPQRKFVNLLLYASLFHQCIAGPIVRYQLVADEIENRKVKTDELYRGIKRFTIGLAKKAILANGCASVADTLVPTLAKDIAEIPAAGLWIGMLFYALQIYLDFSAYSDMAIGMGLMVGFHYDENFNYPYISGSIKEFWNRWHISLGTFFRDYVYIPLGGNRKGARRRTINLLIVWGLTGFWHGASWNFLIWGGYYGVLLIIEKLFLLKVLKKIPAFFSHVYTLFFVVIGWVIFGFDDMTKGWEYLKGMFGFGGLQLVDNMSLYLLLSNLVLILILIVASTPLPAKLGRKIMSMVQTKTWAAMIIENVFIIAIFVVSVAFLVNSTYNPFLYFRF